MTRKSFDAHDVPAGREYVEAYVEYVHFVERLFQATRRSGVGPQSPPSTRTVTTPSTLANAALVMGPVFISIATFLPARGRHAAPR